MSFPCFERGESTPQRVDHSATRGISGKRRVESTFRKAPRTVRTAPPPTSSPAANMSVKKRVKSLGEKLIPISPEFYDTEREEDLVAPKNVLLPFNAFLIVSQWIAFCILMWWYSSEANNVLNTTIQASWDYKRGTYNCTPMMKDYHYGNTFNFDVCMELARPPKISSPAAATDSVIWVEAKQAWKYVPYAHLPTKAAIYSDKTFSFDGGYADATAAAAAETKFKADLANLNTCKKASYGWEDVVGNDFTWLIKKYASGTWVDNPNAPTFSQGYDCCPTHASACKNYDAGSQDSLCKADSCLRPTEGTPDGGCTNPADYEDWRQWCQTYSDRDVSFQDQTKNFMFTQQYRENVHEDFCMYGKIDGLLDKMTKLAGVKNWTNVLTNQEQIPYSYEELFMRYSRSKTLELCEVTEAEALAMFKLYFDSTFVCQYAKSGAPFACESSTPLPISQRFSLAYANSLLLYTVFSAICVKIFFAAKKEQPDKEESAAKGTANNEEDGVSRGV